MELEFLCIKVKLSGWSFISLGGSSPVCWSWWSWWREWRQDTHSTRFQRTVELQPVHLYSVIIIYTSLSHLPFISHYFLFSPLKSQSISNQSHFFKAARFELSLPARRGIDIHHHFLYCYAGLGIIQCFTQPYTEPLSGAGPRISSQV